MNTTKKIGHSLNVNTSLNVGSTDILEGFELVGWSTDADKENNYDNTKEGKKGR